MLDKVAGRVFDKRYGQQKIYHTAKLLVIAYMREALVVTKM